MYQISDEPRKGSGEDLPLERLEEFREKYKSTLSIPTVKTAEQFIICPVGLVGSGKTTVVKPLSEQLSLVRISGDEIRKLLQENGFNYNQTKDIAIPLAETFAKDGYSLAIDSDCAGPRTRKAIEEFKSKYKLHVFWLHINPPEEFIINKLKNFNHTWLFSGPNEAIENYLARKPLHEKLDFPFFCEIDTSRLDLLEQISKCRRKIEDSLKLKPQE